MSVRKLTPEAADHNATSTVLESTRPMQPVYSELEASQKKCIILGDKINPNNKWHADQLKLQAYKRLIILATTRSQNARELVAAQTVLKEITEDSSWVEQLSPAARSAKDELDVLYRKYKDEFDNAAKFKRHDVLEAAPRVVPPINPPATPLIKPPAHQLPDLLRRIEPTPPSFLQSIGEFLHLFKSKP